MTTAIQPRKSLQIKEGTSHCDKLSLQINDLWKYACAHATEALKTERKALRSAIRAGAALLILRGNTPDGEWADTLAARSTIHRSTANRWMRNVHNLLEVCAIPADERAYHALIAETQDDPHTRAVIETVNAFIDGKSASQLELSLRAPKKKTPALPPADQQAERDEQRLRAAEIYVGRVEDLLAAAPSHGEVFDETLLNRFTAALTTALHKVNPGAVR
jgi:hypothetical protein